MTLQIECTSTAKCAWRYTQCDPRISLCVAFRHDVLLLIILSAVQSHYFHADREQGILDHCRLTVQPQYLTCINASGISVVRRRSLWNSFAFDMRFRILMNNCSFSCVHCRSLVALVGPMAVIWSAKLSREKKIFSHLLAQHSQRDSSLTQKAGTSPLPNDAVDTFPRDNPIEFNRWKNVLADTSLGTSLRQRQIEKNIMTDSIRRRWGN